VVSKSGNQVKSFFFTARQKTGLSALNNALFPKFPINGIPGDSEFASRCHDVPMTAMTGILPSAFLQLSSVVELK
jgi:hypothetical protein